jgi:hypothetical protein
LNKPWRPIPSGRVSASTTLKLRWVLVPICLLLSGVYKVTLAASVVLGVATFLYNEMEQHKFWFLKIFITVVGYGAFSAGAVSALSSKYSIRFRSYFRLTYHAESPTYRSTRIYLDRVVPIPHHNSPRSSHYGTCKRHPRRRRRQGNRKENLPCLLSKPFAV